MKSGHFSTSFQCKQGVLCWPFFSYALLYILSSFAIILTRKRELVALFLSSSGCLVAVNVIELFKAVLRVGLQFLIVVRYFLIILTYF